MASIELVRLRSSDGLLFEVPSEVACLSPIVADLRELHDGDDDEEVPLPMVKGHLLAEILGLCEQYVSKGIWDIGAPRDLRSTAGHCMSVGALPDKGTGASSKDSQQLERLAWVADYLGLEELMGLYLEQIAHLVEEATPEHSLVSVPAMRRVLQSRSREIHSMSLPGPTVAVVLEALMQHASRGDLDSVAAVHLYLHDASPVVRKAATAAVGRLAPTDHATSIEHLRRLMNDRESSVQLAALIAIAQVSASGNVRVIELMKEKSIEGDAATRSAAMEALGHVALPGDTRAIAHAKQGMADKDGSVRKASIETFTTLNKKGDTHAALVLINCLNDMESTVRLAAIQSVVATVNQDNDTAIRALLERLEHRYWWVSWAAAKALGEVAPKDKAHIVDAVLSRFGNASPSTRQVALQALSEVASKGSSRVIQSLKPYLQHADRGVRQDAVKALAHFGTGEDLAIKVAMSLLDSGRKSIRKVALEALKLVVPEGSDKAQQELGMRLRHKKVEVRLVALSALLKIGRRNELWVIEALCQRMLDKDSQVQEAADRACEKMVDKGHPHFIFTLLGMHGLCGDDHALRTALRVLPKMVGFSEKSLALVSALLEKQSATTKGAVFDAFMQMFHKSYQQCILAKCPCWESLLAADNVPTEDDKENVQPDMNRSGLGLQTPCEKADVGIRIAIQALSTCLLEPGISLPDAVKTALQKAGVCGDVVAKDLSTCMDAARWFIRWQTVEALCRTALAAKNGEKTRANVTTSAKVSRRSNIENECPNMQKPSLHRTCCPFVAESRRPSKRARFGGA